MQQPLENESLLEDALSEAFSPPPSLRQSELVSSGEAIHVQDTSDAPSSSSIEASEEDTWKAEYERQVKTWREGSAVVREKAEKERAKWEAIREAEREQGVQPAPFPDAPWEKATSAIPRSASPSPADSRDLVAGERSKTAPDPPASSHSRQETTEDSQKWENVPSEVTSSFPSMSFPDSREDSYPDSKPLHAPLAPVSTTLFVFDSSLSTRTRLKALASSLAINLLLPFVNGVMLGFGEIFAKNVVLQWLGWKNTAPGSTASSLGLRGTRR